MDKNLTNQIAENLLTNKIPVALEDQSISDVKKYLLSNIKEFETINYIYVLDEEKKLKGILSTKELFILPKRKKLKEIISGEPIFVKPNTDQEKVAYLSLKHNIKAIPVVDNDDKLIGVVPSDKILEILFYETTEDTMKLAGVSYTSNIDDIFKLSIFASLKHRLPWLVLGLLGGMLAAGIVGNFESTLSKNIILAAFIPMIVYMADAVGTQMEAFIIRDLAIHPKLRFNKYFAYQGLIVTITAFILCILTYGGVSFFYQDTKTAFVIALSLFCAILTSLVTGLVIPFLFSKLKLDPANASGPIATIVQDIMSVSVYFIIASILL